MKKIKFVLPAAMIILVVASALYYSHNVYSESKPKIVSDTTKSQIYVCPMHPEVTSDKPGSCSKCGMDLVLKETIKDQQESMNMKDCMENCKSGKCDMEKCKGESGACKDCAGGNCKTDGKDCKMMKDQDCKSKCMGK